VLFSTSGAFSAQKRQGSAQTALGPRNKVSFREARKCKRGDELKLEEETKKRTPRKEKERRKAENF